MTQHPVPPEGNQQPIREFNPHCPVCAGSMETVYSRAHQQVSVCLDCGSDLTVPTTAWAIVRAKRGEQRIA
jgi:ribosomal protein S27E